VSSGTRSPGLAHSIFLLELAEVAKEKGKVVCCTRLSQPFLLYLVVEVPHRARFDEAGPVFLSLVAKSNLWTNRTIERIRERSRPSPRIIKSKEGES